MWGNSKNKLTIDVVTLLTILTPDKFGAEGTSIRTQEKIENQHGYTDYPINAMQLAAKSEKRGKLS